MGYKGKNEKKKIEQLWKKIRTRSFDQFDEYKTEIKRLDIDKINSRETTLRLKSFLLPLLVT